MKSFRELMCDINHQRNHCDEPSFWSGLFVENFLKTNGSNDDLLFLVRNETHVEVFRNDSKRIPIGDSTVHWEETVYLNSILQQFEYTLTCAVCTRPEPKQLQILKRHSMRVFASPSRRAMHAKGTNEQISYPNIFFAVDNYENLLPEVSVRDGEMICVELLAKDLSNHESRVVFLGSVRYDALRKVYDSRSSRFGRKSQRIEFVRMKGPAGKGIAEIAVDKQKSVESASASETGFCVTRESDDEMEVIEETRFSLFACFGGIQDPEEDQYTRRRMSDPISKNLRKNRQITKARSASEGINGIVEIEAADVRDEFDDATYDGLWTVKGFRQSFHLWKHNRRVSSPPMNGFVTFVSLPWHLIVSDLLGSQPSILTF